MPRPRRLVTYRLLAGAAAVALVAAACGGGGGHTTATTVPTTLRVTTTTTLPPPGAPQLQSVLVQPTDLPTTWTPSAAAPSPTRAADATAFAQCMSTQDTGADVAAAASSPNYTSGSTVISSTAISLATAADVQIDTAALINPKSSTCLVQVEKARLTASLPKTAVLKTVTLTVTPGAGTGPANVVATSTGVVSYTLSGKTTTLNGDSVYLTGPRVEAQINFTNTGTPVPAAVKTALITKVAARVAATP